MDCVTYFSRLDIPDGGENPRVKAALLKFFYDKGFYFDVRSRLEDIFSDFTLDNMVSIWAGEKVSLYPEKKVCLGEKSRCLLEKVLRDRSCSMAGSSTGIIGKIYERSLETAQRKSQGITYTPEDICDYVSAMLRGKTSLETTFLDPACGCGTFLEIFYDSLIRCYWEMSDFELISEAHERILKNSIWGCDTSPYACAIAKITLALKYRRFVMCENIINADSLTDLPESCTAFFDIIASNPPYIGHKTVDAQYRKSIEKLYGEVYYNKADIAYCFFVLGEKLLKPGGCLLYVSSRYFTQSRYADGLRGFILERMKILKVIDFYGARPFKNTGVDPLIIMLKKERPGEDYIIPSVRFLSRSGSAILDDPSVEQLRTPASMLSSSGFNFLSAPQLRLRELTEEKCPLKLSDICEFFQGIITGCDGAFVTDSGDPAAAECGKKWIKSSSITQNGIEYRGLCLLYTDALRDLEEAPHTRERLSGYREKLSRRRECAAGRKEWFRLQWGRRAELFEQPKIVFPYKSASSRFTVDRDGYFFSADIYGMRLRKEFREKLSLDTLALLLNTPLYRDLFFSFAKKLGGALYEYYPNTLGELRMPPAGIIAGFGNTGDIYDYFGEKYEG